MTVVKHKFVEALVHNPLFQTYLKRSQNQVKNQAQLSLHLLWDECKHDKIDPKQRNQKQGWLRQPPETTEQKKMKIPSGETNLLSVFIEVNNEMQLRGTFHFTFRPDDQIWKVNSIKSDRGKIACALWWAYDGELVLSITGKHLNM